jgi:uncharacterized protein YndB with AHSA1/START domain/DNA-binding transcriptional ArsR family regulator
VDGDAVFRALADPSRRILLDCLHERDGRTLVELQTLLAMTRFGVMKHLRVLEEAGLVTTRKAGREKFHYLNPIPIQLLYDRWIGKYTAHHAETLTVLKAVLEGREGEDSMTAETVSAPARVFQVYIKATLERIWEAITKPEFTARYFHGSLVDADLRTGGAIHYHSPDRTKLWCDGEVLESDPPRRLVATWSALWDDEFAGGYCKLTVVHDRLEGAPKTNAAISGGWIYVLSGLKTLLETGEPLAAPAA